MKKKHRHETPFDLLDPLRDYPEMMSAQDVAEFSGISEGSARAWIQKNGGVIVVKGQQREVWRIHKEYVRRGMNLPRATA